MSKIKPPHTPPHLILQCGGGSQQNDKTKTPLWRALRRDALGVRFRRQLVFDGRYILDFYAPEIRLNVEVDGGQHAGSLSDAARDGALAARGVTIARVWNSSALNRLDGVLTRLSELITALKAWRAAPDTSPLAPLLPGGGSAGLTNCASFQRLAMWLGPVHPRR